MSIALRMALDGRKRVQHRTISGDSEQFDYLLELSYVMFLASVTRFYDISYENLILVTNLIIVSDIIKYRNGCHKIS